MIHKSGFINIIGNPNVGKSTLMNRLIGERLAIVTPKPQTTRERILGIVNGNDYQLVFSDTPGILKPVYSLQSEMMSDVKTAIEDADILLLMVQPNENAFQNPNLIDQVNALEIPVLLLINKIDRLSQNELEHCVAFWYEQFSNINILPISAKENLNLDFLLKKLIDLIPECPPYYPKDQLTDKPERFFVNETIREKILLNFEQEIPYAVAVITERFLEQEDKIYIESVIYVERESQKGILIGHMGKNLSLIGKLSRLDLQKFFEKKIHLKLFIKVRKNWRNNLKDLKGFGYKK